MIGHGLHTRTLRIEKRHNEGLYKFVRRNLGTVDLKEIFEVVNSHTIQEAAIELGLDPIQLLIFVGHLYKVNIVKEVRIV